MVHLDRAKSTDPNRLGSPLASSVAERISDLIRTGEFEAGSGLPSERDLSRRFSVSRGVLRVALKELAASGVIESRANCRPVVSNRPSKSAAAVKQIYIWLWPNMADFAVASIIKGIQRARLDDDVRLVFGHAVSNDWDSIYDTEHRFLTRLIESPDPCGAIIWLLGHNRSFDIVEQLGRKGIPAVFIDRLPPPGLDADFVGTCNELAAEQAVRHLIELGHKRVALMTNMEACSSVREREAGYRRALLDAGIGIDKSLIFTNSHDGPQGVHSVVDRALAMPQRPTALFCINDHMALQAVDAVRQRGLSVPEDLSIVGFDGILRWVPQGGGLTTVLQDFQRIGQIAADLVIERMTHGPSTSHRHILLDAPLAVHGSTARAPVQ